MTTYDWKPSAGIKVDPQIAGETVEMLRERLGGQVKPADLLAHAEQSNSPLHAAFEWDNDRAAAKHRLDQAAHILRSLVVTVKMQPKAEERFMRAFVSVIHRERGRGYTSLAAAMSDADYRAQVIANALRELQAWRERYGDYSELAQMHAAIDATVAQQAA